MSDKKIVIVSDRLMHIDGYRGELNRTEFVRVCIERVLSRLEKGPEKKTPERKEASETAEFVTKQEFDQFKQSLGGQACAGIYGLLYNIWPTTSRRKNSQTKMPRGSATNP